VRSRPTTREERIVADENWREMMMALSPEAREVIRGLDEAVEHDAPIHERFRQIHDSEGSQAAAEWMVSDDPLAQSYKTAEALVHYGGLSKAEQNVILEIRLARNLEWMRGESG